MLPLESLRLGGQVGVVPPNRPGPSLSGAVTPSPGTLGFHVSLWPGVLLVVWGPGTPARTRAEAWQAGPPGMPRARPLPAPFPVGGMDGLPSAGPCAHCAGEGKWAPGSCRPAMDVLAAGDRTVATVSWRLLPGPAGARFAVEKQLGTAWHPASCPHRCHYRGKVFIQQFPREPGTWNVRGAQGAAAEWGG